VSFAESTIEEAAIDWLKDLGYTDLTGFSMAHDGRAPAQGKGDR
jgi:hypothetical protein